MRDRVLMLPGTSYAVMPPMQIGYGLISQHSVTPSKSGHAISFIASSPHTLLDPTQPEERGLYAHRISTGRTSRLLRLERDHDISFTHWLGDRVAAVHYTGGVMELSLFGPNEGQRRNITSWTEHFSVRQTDDEGENLQPPPWPTGHVRTDVLGGTDQVLYILAQTGTKSRELWTLSASGQFTRRALQDEFAHLGPAYLMQDGLITFEHWTSLGGIFTVLDPATGRISERDYSEEGPKFGLLVDRPGDRENQKVRSPRALVLVGFGYDPFPEPALVTNDGIAGGVMPGQKAVWYVDTFGLYLCDLVPMDSERLEKFLRDTVKREAILTAKQIATGMMIYMADNDDYLPRSGDWRTALSPYYKDTQFMDGFVYLGNGENFSQIKDPANQVMGYIETPYGRAIVRMDTSVKWEDKPKTLALDRG